MPRKPKNNKRTSSSSGTTIASRRHWIYAATTTKNDTHQNYLHQRVQRILVRSVPSTYSYFDGAVNDAAVATGGIIEEGKAAADDTVAKDESNEIQQVPHSTKLTYTQIPLPPQQPSDTTSSSDTATTATTQYPSSYSKFTTPIITKDSRHAKFQFSLNYETHVPSKALISYVGTTTTASSSGSGENESGYVLQLPLSMGTVIGYSPPLEEGDDVVVGGGEEEEEEEGEFAVERMECGEPLFRVLWDGCTAAVTSDGGDGGEGSSDGKKKKKKNVVGYTEDLTLEELLTCLVTQPATKSSSSRSRNTTTDAPAAPADGIIIPPKILTQKALSIHKHVHATTTRKQLSLEEKMENELLPHLVILASLELRKEIAQKIRLELLLERKKRRAEMGLGGGSRSRRNANGEEMIVNEDGMAYQYYMRHPNQYLSSFQAPPSLPSDDEESDCEESEDVVDNMEVGGGGEGGSGGGHVTSGGSSKRSSKTKLSKQELVTYNEKVAAACNFAPSKLAERVKLACSMAFEYASRKGLLEAYYVECEQRKERERIEKEKMARDATGVAAKGSAFGLGGIDGTGEVRRSGRARTTVSYYNDDGSRAVDDVVAGEAKKAGEFVVGSLPGENVSGGPSARYLLDVLGMMPKEGAAKSEDNGENSDEESVPEEEDGGDPFFEPSHCLIIDQLGRKHRYMSPAQIQIAIVRSIDGEIVETPKCLLDEEQAGDDHHYITDIVCTTEDKKSDLPQYEPASFARCRFTPHTLMQERVEEDEEDEVDVAAQKQAEREAKAAERARKEERRRVRLAAEQKRNAELERAYRAKKAYELWRFRSIHGDGCTIWPLWSERAQSLLNNLFTMSRVNSIEAIMDVSSSADVQGQAQPAAEAGVNGGASTTQNDEELARSLAAAADANDNEPLAKRRRTTRRAAGGDEPVFYGGHQSMSRDQLLESLVRLLRQAKPGSSSLMDLKRLVFADDYDMSRGGAVEMRKLRSALGHLIYRLGKIGRLTVDVESDSACMDLLKEGALVKFVSDEPQIKEDGEAVKSEQGADVTMSDSVPLAPVVDEHLKRQLSALEQYMCNLQHTEFSLRAALMKALDKGGKGGETLMQLSTLAIATAADETEGAADAGDWEFYLPKKTEENGGSDAGNANIKWSSSNHAFIGQVIFRPQTSSLRPQGADVDPTEKCHWYRVVSYAASKKADELVGDEKPGNNVDTDARPNVIVERRMRFRAVPIAESDIDAPPMDTGMDSDDEISYMILTEAQVKAGIEALSLHRRISAHTNGNTQSSSLQTHPFRNRAGSRVMLTPVDGQFEVIYGIITGFDLSTGNGIKHKVLILLEDGDKESLKESCAVWASVDAEGTRLTDIHPDNEQKVPSLCSEYKIDMHEYYPGSEAYSVCESVVTYLQNHAKSGPFMEPVDPIALGIPDYPNVVKNPMDVSTLLKNLQEGTYSRIPPKPLHSNDDEEEGTDHPVYRMAYGPFYEALMLIFDNAILYNGINTWIGADASLLKKNVIRKIDQAVSKATWYGQTSAKKPSVASGAKKSVYADEDSDVDMYEYESDYEDEEGGGRRKARKARSQAKRKKKYHAKEDIASKAIEKPFELPEGVSGFGAGGAFPHLKVQTNVGKFSLPQNWSCRHVQEEEEVKDENGGEEASEEEEMLMLMQMQQEEEHGIRRSSRARQAPKSYADEVTDAPATTPTTQSPVSIPGVEYYMIDGDIFQPAQSSGADVDFIPTVCRSRLGAEGVQETIHELFFGKLYRDHSPNAMILGDGLGTYANGSFPPFLGRVIKTNSANNVWEIREQYLIPALRWVLRGLVKSGHLAEVDGSLSDGLLDDAAARTSFGAGIVVPSHEYYYNETFPPFEVLDEKEVLRKRRQEAAVDDDSSSDEEVELSEYEKMRAERVARNAERLKLLGLA